jgi:hypothetical protein
MVIITWIPAQLAQALKYSKHLWFIGDALLCIKNVTLLWYQLSYPVLFVRLLFSSSNSTRFYFLPRKSSLLLQRYHSLYTDQQTDMPNNNMK